MTINILTCNNVQTGRKRRQEPDDSSRKRLTQSNDSPGVSVTPTELECFEEYFKICSNKIAQRDQLVVPKAFLLGEAFLLAIGPGSGTEDSIDVLCFATDFKRDQLQESTFLFLRRLEDDFALLVMQPPQYIHLPPTLTFFYSHTSQREEDVLVKMCKMATAIYSSSVKFHDVFFSTVPRGDFLILHQITKYLCADNFDHIPYSPKFISLCRLLNAGSAHLLIRWASLKSADGKFDVLP